MSELAGRRGVLESTTRETAESIVRRCFGALALVGLAVAGSAGAADLHVATTGDDANDCSSAASACLTIQRAVDVAVGGDVIHVAAGIYAETVTIAQHLTIEGAGRSATTVTGNGADRVFDIFAGTVVISSLTITGGLPPAPGSGAGIRSAGDLTLIDVAVSGNRARGGIGGGILSDGPLTLRDCLVSDNDACFHAGVSSQGPLVVTGSMIRNNRADDSCDCGMVSCSGTGGGLGIGDTATIVDTTIRDNDGGGGGGGISTNGTLSIVSSTIHGNVADDGGGLLLTGGAAVLTNATISDNRATFLGGGIMRFSGTARLLSSTVAGNRGLGGGIYGGEGSISLRSTILTGSDSGPGSSCEGEIASEGHLVVGDSTRCLFTGDLTGNVTDVDVLLAPLADNGGPTPTRAPRPGSPAIDAGDPAGCRDDAGSALVTDQRGSPRPKDGDGDLVPRCDVGAVEVDCDAGVDTDGDGFADPCDTCPGVADPLQADGDLDGVGDACDACPATFDPLQRDGDADGLGDACDCAPADASAHSPPGETRLRVERGAAPGAVRITWDDVGGVPGVGTVTYEVASAGLSELHLRRMADGPCLALGLTGLEYEDAGPSPAGGAYYLVRGTNACGPGAGEGWGVDSRLQPRPACP